MLLRSKFTCARRMQTKPLRQDFFFGVAKVCLPGPSVRNLLKVEPIQAFIMSSVQVEDESDMGTAKAGAFSSQS